MLGTRSGQGFRYQRAQGVDVEASGVLKVLVWGPGEFADGLENIAQRLHELNWSLGLELNENAI